MITSRAKRLHLLPMHPMIPKQGPFPNARRTMHESHNESLYRVSFLRYYAVEPPNQQVARPFTMLIMFIVSSLQEPGSDTPSPPCPMHQQTWLFRRSFHGPGRDTATLAGTRVCSTKLLRRVVSSTMTFASLQRHALTDFTESRSSLVTCAVPLALAPFVCIPPPSVDGRPRAHKPTESCTYVAIPHVARRSPNALECDLATHEIRRGIPAYP
jgi:hypothetical protein